MQEMHWITRRQLFALMFISLLSPIIRLLPRMAVAQAGTAAWLSPLVAAPVLLFLLWMSGCMLRTGLPGEGLGEIFQRCLGRVAGRIAAGIFGLWIFLYAGFILRAGTERLLSTIYPSGHVTPFVVVMAAVALIAARGKLRTLARAGEVFFLLLLVIVFSVLLFAAPQVQLENLLPLYPEDLGRASIGALPVVDVLSPWVYLLFLWGHVKQREDEKTFFRSGTGWLGLALLLVFLLMIITIGSFGGRLIVEMQAPFFLMIRDIRIFNVVERIESVVVGIWIIADLTFIAALLSAGTEALRGSLGLKRGGWLAYAGDGIALLAAYLSAATAFRFTRVSERVVPVVNLVLLFVILPLICLIGKNRKKLKKGA